MGGGPRSANVTRITVGGVMAQTGQALMDKSTGARSQRGEGGEVYCKADCSHIPAQQIEVLVFVPGKACDDYHLLVVPHKPTAVEVIYASNSTGRCPDNDGTSTS